MLEESEGSVARGRHPDVRRVNDPLSERAPAPHLLAGEGLVYRARYEAIAHALALPVAEPRPLSSSLGNARPRPFFTAQMCRAGGRYHAPSWADVFQSFAGGAGRWLGRWRGTACRHYLPL